MTTQEGMVCFSRHSKAVGLIDADVCKRRANSACHLLPRRSKSFRRRVAKPPHVDLVGFSFLGICTYFILQMWI